MTHSEYHSRPNYLQRIVPLILGWALLFLLASPVFSQGLEIPVFVDTLERDRDVPYVPTPDEVVREMLQLANVDSSDYVIDLGSGDGRIVISAARRGAVGHGVDLDAELLKTARTKAKQAGVDDRVMFLQEDLFTTDIREASVITLYLLSSVNRKLRPRLLEELRPGTRVVSHDFDMDEWKPDSTLAMETDSENIHHLYLWIIPADISGYWQWEHNGSTYHLRIQQTFQKIEAVFRTESTIFEVKEAMLEGSRIRFTAIAGDTRRIYSGRIGDGIITGFVQTRQGEERRITNWQAIRQD